MLLLPIGESYVGEVTGQGAIGGRRHAGFPDGMGMGWDGLPMSKEES